MPDLTQLADLIVGGRSREVEAYTKGLLSEGVTPEAIVAEGFMPGMYEVGRRFDQQECFITDMLMSARATKLGYAVIQDWLGATLPVCKYKVIIGTVQGDLHDIGKNLVAMAMRSVGLEVIDLGVDVPAQKFVDTVKENPDVKIVCLSALLTTTMPAMKEAVAALAAEDFRANIKIMVGGAPITQEFADEIGADAYTTDAASCAQKAKELV